MKKKISDDISGLQKDVPGARYNAPGSRPAPLAMAASVLLIAIAGILVYWNSLDGKFVWDDTIQIQDNKAIRSWNNPGRIFTENIGSGAGREYNFYRPLQILTLMADYSSAGLKPVRYHLTNIFLHIAAALCAYWLARLLLSDGMGALFAALLFTVHPVHTEAVSYISGRADPLSAVFVFLCLIFYIKDLRSTAVSVFLVVMSYVLAVLSKENALVLPLLAALYSYMFGRFNMKKMASILAVTVIYIVLRFTVLNFPGQPPAFSNTFLERVPGFFVAITNYARILILPVDLRMEYGDQVFGVGDPRVWIGFAIFCGAVFYAVRQKARDPLVTFSIAWFFTALLPQSNLYRINAYMAEHWLYLPSFGVFLIAARYIIPAYREKRLRVPAVIFGAAILVFYSYLTARQCLYWKEPVAFYERTLRYAPYSARVYNNLAKLYNDSGRHEEAIALYSTAVKINPRYSEAYNNLGVALYDIGKNSEAIESYKMAVAIDPKFAGAYNNLGAAYLKAHMTGEAMAALNEAVRIAPGFADVYNNMAMVYRQMARHEEEAALIQKAIGLDPSNPIMYFNLANAYVSAGKYDDAIRSYREAIRVDPNKADAYNNIGFLLKSTGRPEESVPFFTKAMTIDPKLAEAYENLALVYADAGRREDAISVCRLAMQNDPDRKDRYGRVIEIIYGRSSAGKGQN